MRWRLEETNVIISKESLIKDTNLLGTVAIYMQTFCTDQLFSYDKTGYPNWASEMKQNRTYVIWSCNWINCNSNLEWIKRMIYLNSSVRRYIINVCSIVKYWKHFVKYILDTHSLRGRILFKFWIIIWITSRAVKPWYYVDGTPSACWHSTSSEQKCRFIYI